MSKNVHPISGKVLEGRRLQPGEQIKPGDRYDSTDGRWLLTSTWVGAKVPEGDHVIWVRPPTKTS